MGAVKVSISVDEEDLAWLRKRARTRGGNLSAVFADATKALRQREARERVVKRFGADAAVSEDEAAEIRAEWRGSRSTRAR